MQYSQTRYEDTIPLGIGDTDLSLVATLVAPTRTQGILTIGRLQGNTEDVYYTNVVGNTVTISLRGLSETALTPTQVVGNRKVHNANESLEITTHHLYDANKARKDEADTISGDWEFTGTETFADDKARSKTNAAPVDEKSFSNKKYVDDQVAGVADIKVKVSSDDTTPGFLEDKITVSAPLVLTTTSPAGNEQRNIAFDDTVVQNIVVNVSSAEIKTLFSSPKLLIAAPGVGKALIINHFILAFTYGTIQYTGGGRVIPRFVGGTINVLGNNTGSVVNSTILQAAANSINYRVPLFAPVDPVSNTGVELTCDTANFATGDGTAKIFIQYRIITL